MKSYSVAVLLLVGCFSCLLSQALGQRDDRDSDDFDDSGFDDSGYNSPQSHDAEGSHHNPSSYSPANEEDLDDDDEVDESNNVAKVASGGPQQFWSPANSIVMPIPMHQVRHKRSIEQPTAANNVENDVEDAQQRADSSRPLIRKRRYSKKYIGPVYTYVKTDKHAHYKWGVKHKVGKHYG